MSKDKKEKIGPGIDSTLQVPLSIINEMALSFAKVAIDEFAKIHYGDTLDVRKYTSFTNGALALELFFKSFTAERKYYPSYIKLTSEEDYEVFTDEEYLSNPEQSIVGVLHSVIEIPKAQRKHDLDLLFTSIPAEEKKIFLDYVYERSPLIKDEASFFKFITDIKLYFVEKRYPFEDFQFSVPADNSHLRTLHNVLFAMISYIEKRQKITIWGDAQK